MEIFRLQDYCYKNANLAVWDLHSERMKQPIHTHDCVELCYVYGGSGWCAVDGVHYPMFAGDLYMMLPGTTHEFFEDTRLNAINIMFNREVFATEELYIYDAFKDILKSNHKISFDPNAQPEALAILKKLADEMNYKNSFAEPLMHSLFISFIIFILRYGSSLNTAKPTSSPTELGRICSYIATHYAEHLTLETLASRTPYTAEYLGRLFSKNMGVTVSNYIRYYRIKKAEWILQNTNNSIDDIALQTGFVDAAHFSKVFKKLTGSSPAKWRKKLKVL